MFYVGDVVEVCKCAFSNSPECLHPFDGSDLRGQGKIEALGQYTDTVLVRFTDGYWWVATEKVRLVDFVSDEQWEQTYLRLKELAHQ